MKTILLLTALFLLTSFVGVAQEQATVQFSVRVADFQSIKINSNAAPFENGNIKSLENNTIKIIGTTPYELQVSRQSVSDLHDASSFHNSESLAISGHDEYDNSSKMKKLSKNEAKIIQSSKTSMELNYNPGDFILATSQVTPTQVIAYSLMPN